MAVLTRIQNNQITDSTITSQKIAAGTLVSVYDSGNYEPLGTSPIYNFTRAATGPTIVVGSNESPVISGGILTVRVSLPNSSGLSSVYYDALSLGPDTQTIAGRFQIFIWLSQS